MGAERLCRSGSAWPRLYRTLYGELLQRAHDRGGVCGIRLYVEGHNEAVKRTYAKLGMSATVYEMWEEDFVLQRDKTGAVEKS